MNKVRVGVAFDLDGTLVESAPDLMNALNHALREADRPAVDLAAVKTMIGDGIATLVARGFEATGGLPDDATLAAAVQSCLAYYEAHPIDHSVLFEGVEPCLRSLMDAGYVLGICTNKPVAPARDMLASFGILDCFEAVVGGDSHPYRKPDPRLLLRCLESMGSPVERALLVGDSRNDALAAHGANVPFVFVTFGYNTAPVEELGPAAVVGDFATLNDVISGILPPG